MLNRLSARDYIRADPGEAARYIVDRGILLPCTQMQSSAAPLCPLWLYSPAYVRFLRAKRPPPIKTPNPATAKTKLEGSGTER